MFSVPWRPRWSPIRAAARPQATWPTSCDRFRSGAARAAATAHGSSEPTSGRRGSTRVRSRRPGRAPQSSPPVRCRPGWPLGLAALAGALGFAAPRAAVLFTLAIAFFPLANISVGLATVYAAAAAVWAVLTWRDARGGLLLALGPLLAPLAALALLPLAVQTARGKGRRALQAAAGVVLAAVVAGLRHASLPFDGSAAPLGLGITGSARPTAVATALLAELGRHPELVAEAAVLGAAAAALPFVRGRGP